MSIAILYHLKLSPDKEIEYIEYWQRMVDFMKTRGALGSTIHRQSDQTILIYSQWPDLQTYENAWPQEENMEQELPTEIFELALNMKSCIDEHIDIRITEVLAQK